MPLKNALIQWTENTPKSTEFDDIYFHQDEGLAETEYVFIQGNRLDELLASSTNRLVIGETGFGTGMNFLATLAFLDAFLEAHQLSSTEQQKTKLHFISTELFPLNKADLSRALKQHPCLKGYSEQIVQQYPDNIPGIHRLILNDGAVYLTLCLGDATQMFTEIQAKIDAWYLDGFTPSRNPAMWTDTLYQQLARLSHEKTRLATFTAASAVRRGLITAGFDMQKRKGFGSKREMLFGQYTKTTPSEVEKKTVTGCKPWFNLPTGNTPPQSVVIIGAGIAGCASAEALARRGIKVTLVDRNDTLASEGSGNKQGALYAKLSKDPTRSTELHLCGLTYTRNTLSRLSLIDGKTAEICGLIQLATSTKQVQHQQGILDSQLYHSDVVRRITAEQATQLAGTHIEHSGLYFPNSGWVAPKAFSQALIAHENINFIGGFDVDELVQKGDGWLVKSAKDMLCADVVIVACAEKSTQFSQTKSLPLKAIRGQVSEAAVTSQLKLNTVVCAAGYVSPAIHGTLSFGATFDLHHLDKKIRAQDHQFNYENLQAALPQAGNALPDISNWQGRVAYRCATPDYLPAVGPAYIAEAYKEQYAQLRKDRKWPFADEPAPLYNGLFINTGHGSKGLITAPLCAEYLASIICDEPIPLTHSITQAIHPARFLIKDLIRKKQ